MIGHTLWNFLYDCLLWLLTLEGVEIIAYTDDIALVARALVIFKVGELLEEMADRVVNWLTEVGIELAMSQMSIRYLGVHIDCKANFKAHTPIVVKKTDAATRALRGIMLNTRGPTFNTRKLLAVIPHLILLYGAPVWCRTMTPGA